jgi:hypothetical protein
MLLEMVVEAGRLRALDLVEVNPTIDTHKCDRRVGRRAVGVRTTGTVEMRRTPAASNGVRRSRFLML